MLSFKINKPASCGIRISDIQSRGFYYCDHLHSLVYADPAKSTAMLFSHAFDKVELVERCNLTGTYVPVVVSMEICVDYVR